MDTKLREANYKVVRWNRQGWRLFWRWKSAPQVDGRIAVPAALASTLSPARSMRQG
jgi:hypothetical protein